MLSEFLNVVLSQPTHGKKLKNLTQWRNLFNLQLISYILALYGPRHLLIASEHYRVTILIWNRHQTDDFLSVKWGENPTIKWSTWMTITSDVRYIRVPWIMNVKYNTKVLEPTKFVKPGLFGHSYPLPTNPANKIRRRGIDNTSYNITNLPKNVVRFTLALEPTLCFVHLISNFKLRLICKQNKQNVFSV